MFSEAAIHQRRSCPADVVRYGSYLDWLRFGSLCQSFEDGPGYSLYLGGLVGFDEGDLWIAFLPYFG